MTQYGYFEITRSCLRCGRPLPVNGPLENVRCASCFETNPVPLLMYLQVFQIACKNDEQIYGGETRTQTPITDGGPYKLTWGTHEPACRACGAVLSGAPPAAGAYPCPGCGTAVTTFEPPGWMKDLYPGAVQIYLGVQESASTDQGPGLQLDQARTHPVAMPCSTCGGGLSIGVDTPIEHMCGFCGSPVTIPDEIWDRLHPTEAVQGWYVRFELPVPECRLEMRMDLAERFKKQVKPIERSDGRMNANVAGPSRFACLKIGNLCGNCKTTIPINGPVLHPVCPTCGTLRDLPPQALGHLMAWVEEEEPSFVGSYMQYGYFFKVKRTRVQPFCVRCESDLPLVKPGTDAVVECPKCSARYPTFPVPGEIRFHAGHARQVYCAQRDSDLQALQASAAVDFGCPSCGANITIDTSTPRIHRCQYCRNDVFIPDQVWHRFHPVTKMLPWFVDAGRVPPSAEIKRRAEADAVMKQADRGVLWDKIKFWIMFLLPVLFVLAMLGYQIYRIFS